MSGIAVFAREMGYEGSGSDRSESDLTARLRESGVRIYLSHAAEHVVGADAVVFTAAVGGDNPEMAYAAEHGIPTVSRAQFLGYIMCRYENKIGVSGSHGKSTTSSMLSHVFLEAGLDPTVALGAELSEIGGAYRMGRGRDFIYESCEYKDSFLSFYPDIAVILNIDHDHVDYFLTMEHMTESFRQSIRGAHTVIALADDARVDSALEGYTGRVIRFGMNEGCDFYPRELTYERGKARFTVMAFGEAVCEVSLAVPGEHNVLDALAAAAAAFICGVGAEDIGRGLGNFVGARRRFERKGSVRGIDVYDDYAHHPTEIRATLSGISKLGYRRVICVFQPHTYSRTAELFDEFTASFGAVDEVVFLDIFSARETDTLGVSSSMLAEQVEGAKYFPSFDEAVEYLRSASHAGDLILTMGAGDVYKIGERFLVTE
ncbi:MAG: UDP-N-acetylmuramate--L-alanine ligase, partial [Clostridia bacterium]|nr:UDP-N-acetylmuramate--L-alanine ligase [Clostridia bacterium]